MLKISLGFVRPAYLVLKDCVFLVEHNLSYGLIVAASVDVSSVESQTVYICIMQSDDLDNCQGLVPIFHEHELGTISCKQSGLFG